MKRWQAGITNTTHPFSPRWTSEFVLAESAKEAEDQFEVITTQGTRNIRIEVKGSDSPSELIERMKKQGGIWVDTSYFPFHSMMQFDLETYK